MLILDVWRKNEHKPECVWVFDSVGAHNDKWFEWNSWSQIDQNAYMHTTERETEQHSEQLISQK